MIRHLFNIRSVHAPLAALIAILPLTALCEPSDPVPLPPGQFVAPTPEQSDNQAVAERDELLRRVKEVVASAKEPAELDELNSDALKAIRSHRSSDYRQEAQGLFNDLSNIRSFIEGWQAFLKAKQSGDHQGAVLALSSILHKENQMRIFVPPSQLLDMIEEYREKEVHPIPLVMGIRSLDEIRDVLAKIPREPAVTSQRNLGEVCSGLAEIDKTYREYLAGAPFVLSLSPHFETSDGFETAGKLAELRGMLLKKVLPRYIDAPADLDAQDEENAVTYLERILTVAHERQDLELARRAEDTRRLLYGRSALADQDALGMKAYNSGRNQETAGEFALAAYSYLQALDSGSMLIPAESIGLRLREIKGSHLADYDAGMKRHLEPSRSFDSNLGSERFRNLAGYALLIPAPRKENAAKDGEKHDR